MTIRFRISEQALLQQRRLQVPLSLLEAWVQPQWRGASMLLAQADLARFSTDVRRIAQGFLGLYVVADGRGTIMQIARMQHRLAVAEQDVNLAISVAHRPLVHGAQLDQIASTRTYAGSYA